MLQLSLRIIQAIETEQHNLKVKTLAVTLNRQTFLSRCVFASADVRKYHQRKVWLVFHPDKNRGHPKYADIFKCALELESTVVKFAKVLSLQSRMKLIQERFRSCLDDNDTKTPNAEYTIGVCSETTTDRTSPTIMSDTTPSQSSALVVYSNTGHSGVANVTPPPTQPVEQRSPRPRKRKAPTSTPNPSIPILLPFKLTTKETARVREFLVEESKVNELPPLWANGNSAEAIKHLFDKASQNVNKSTNKWSSFGLSNKTYCSDMRAIKLIKGWQTKTCTKIAKGTKERFIAWTWWEQPADDEKAKAAWLKVYEEAKTLGVNLEPGMTYLTFSAPSASE